jgi:hypothetical protein
MGGEDSDGWLRGLARRKESDMESRSRRTRVNPCAWASAGIEPSLDEMLADPVVVVVMDSDAVTEDDVRALFRAVDLDRIRRHRAAGVSTFAVHRAGERASAAYYG